MKKETLKPKMGLLEEEYNKIGIHGNNCPHCLGGDCECHCEICRSDLWEKCTKKSS